ncbi:hypothetical protein [Mycobacterium sp. 4858]|uniref:hypothetical protein n=1 Tax=Mycobacterium sp. 4858 TaxID=2057185 RepID=UPI000C85CAC4|nr:hypothetical protein [Mycobacterium sp. 4858]
MVTSSSPTDPAGRFGPQLLDSDTAAVIDAQEQNLQQYLNLPVDQILARLGFPSFADPTGIGGTTPFGGEPTSVAPMGQQAPAAPITPMDPSALIQPVTSALGTLGNGAFQGLDPTQMLGGITNAFQSTGGPLQQALGSLGGIWQGVSSGAAVDKTTAAIANGKQVAAQADALRSSLTTATADVAQARSRLIEIISEFESTLAAIGPNIVFPWGWAAAIAAANHAITSTAEVMTQLQASLSAEAAKVTAVGAPVTVTAAPQVATAGSAGTAAAGTAAAAGSAGSAGSGTSGLASSLMSAAPQALSYGASSLSQGLQSVMQAGNAARGPGSLAAAPLTDAAATAIHGSARGAAGAAGHVAGGAGGAATAAARSIPTSAMVQPPSGTAAVETAGARPASAVGAPGAGVMGGGSPMAPGGARLGAGSSHTSPSFLHTTDQGGEIVGDLGTAAPAVIGQSDPNEPPDVALRI